jgi:hypothetical protein
MKVMMVALAALLAWESAVAGEVPSIIQGFGKTKWGQTRQEVAALVTPSSTKPNTVDRSRVPNIVAAGDGPIDRVDYCFSHDRLVGVVVHIPLPADLDAGAATERVRETIDAKYHDKSRPEAFEALRTSGIDIWACASRSSPAGGTEICVTYWHTKLASDVSEHERAQRQADAGEASKRTKEAIERMRLDRLL